MKFNNAKLEISILEDDVIIKVPLKISLNIHKYIVNRIIFQCTDRYLIIGGILVGYYVNVESDVKIL